MKERYNYENNNGKEYYCTPTQWKYWNRKAIAEHKKKIEKWVDESGMFDENVVWKFLHQKGGEYNEISQTI